MDITSVDKNFEIKSNISRDGLTFINVLDREEFSVHGVFYEDGKFRRLPEDVAKNTNDGVHYLHTHTAGGRVRFRTNSPYIAIHVNYNVVEKMAHFPFTGSIGFDLFRNGIYIGTYTPSTGITDTLDSVIDVGLEEEAEYTLNMPLYSGVSALYVGLKEGSRLLSPSPYRIELPVVYYGSSITQGGCASRAGNAYQAVISRVLNVDHVNLGFSGSAKGEAAISDYIASLKMSAFVLDYDHNAPSVEHLKATHKALFDNVRKHHPDLPILLLSRPKYHLSNDEKQRLEVVRQTYLCALADGDKNVYFIPGNELIEERFAEHALVDNCHPNDCGFVSMAYAIIPVMKKMLGL